MKIIKTFLLCCSLSFVVKGALSQNSNSNKDIEAIKKMEYDWLVAEFKMDTATIAPMMDERFVSVGLTGLSNKQEELRGMFENIRERLRNDHVVDSLYLDDVHIQIYGNTAVATFFSVTRGRIKAVPFENRRTRIYDVWIKFNGRWKAISSQVTPVR